MQMVSLLIQFEENNALIITLVVLVEFLNRELRSQAQTCTYFCMLHWYPNSSVALRRTIIKKLGHVT